MRLERKMQEITVRRLHRSMEGRTDSSQRGSGDQGVRIAGDELDEVGLTGGASLPEYVVKVRLHRALRADPGSS